MDWQGSPRSWLPLRDWSLCRACVDDRDCRARGGDSFGIEGTWDFSKESHEDGFKVDPTAGAGAPEFSDGTGAAVTFWGEQTATDPAELILRDLRNGVAVSSRDVGIGISQLIPVVVHALAERESTILVEQPELHLHPALQARLGYFFMETALGPHRNQFILETHSEHLILRVMKRIRLRLLKGSSLKGQPRITPNHVCILRRRTLRKWQHCEGNASTNVASWSKAGRGGFFEEALNEMFEP